MLVLLGAAALGGGYWFLNQGSAGVVAAEPEPEPFEEYPAEPYTPGEAPPPPAPDPGATGPDDPTGPIDPV